MTEYSHLTNEQLHEVYKATQHSERFFKGCYVDAYKRCEAIEAEIQRRVSG